MKIRGFITHKQAEQYIDCQDYFSVDTSKRKLAVSDGMTQSIFSAYWAKVLVRSYVHKEWDGVSNIDKLQNEWLEYVKSELKCQEKDGMPTWMLENALNMKQGAGATFCGICFDGFNWHSLVLGDTSIIQVNENDEIIEIIKSGNDEFDNHPDYYDSFGEMVGKPVSNSGVLEHSCKLLLVSDPIAELLNNRKDEDSSTLVSELLSVKNHQEFCDLVDNWRKNMGMHNDDSTLIIIEHDDMEQFNIDSCIDDLDTLIKNESKESNETDKAL